MARLYAEITSDKGGRVVGKSGEKYVQVRFMNKNRDVYIAVWKGDELLITNHDGTQELQRHTA
jgi:hypothetical protein